MELFATRDKKIVELEKRLALLEKSILRMNESFAAFSDATQKMQKEGVDLKKDRDFLLERYKEVLRKIDALPLKPISAIRETSELIKDIAAEGTKPGADDLFDLIMKKKRVTAKQAARELGMDEEHVRYFASKLDERGLIERNEDEYKKKSYR